MGFPSILNRCESWYFQDVIYSQTPFELNLECFFCPCYLHVKKITLKNKEDETICITELFRYRQASLIWNFLLWKAYDASLGNLDNCSQFWEKVLSQNSISKVFWFVPSIMQITPVPRKHKASWVLPGIESYRFESAHYRAHCFERPLNVLNLQVSHKSLVCFHLKFWVLVKQWEELETSWTQTIFNILDIVWECFYRCVAKLGVCISMSHRRTQGASKQKFPSKPKGITLNINIWEDRFPTSTDQGNRSRIGDFENHLRAHNFQVEKAHDPATVSGNARNINIQLKTTEYGNTGKFFERLRRQWCSSICRLGDSFWLESAETSNNTFKYKSDGTRQVLQTTSFSFGSFFNRGTYIKHWSSDEDAPFIDDGNIQSEFEHDTKTLAITYFKAGAPEGFKEVRIEMEYKQFENYVVVNENISQGTIHFYFPLQWPPKVSEGN